MRNQFNLLLHGRPEMVADILSGDNPPEMTPSEVRALLTNALSRIAILDMTTREILEYLLAMQSHDIPPVSAAGLFQALDALQTDGVTDNE